MKKSTISIIKKLTCTTFCALLLSANFALIALADEDTSMPTPTSNQTTNLNNLNQKFNSIVNIIPKDTQNRPKLEIPTEILNNQNWETSTDLQRNNYCQVIEYLKEYIRFSQTNLIFDNRSLSQSEANKINDPRCTSLVCDSTTNLTRYYRNSSEASALRQTGATKICSIDNQPEAKCILNLPEYINQCIDCKNKIEEYIQQVSRGATASIPAECNQFRNVHSCNSAFTCTNNGTLEVNSNEGRIPFGTEFFDINDPVRGFGIVPRTELAINDEGGGIAYIINTIANFLAGMIATLSLLIFIIGSFILITANGDENQINRGKDAIKYSILGIFIVLLSYTIVVLTQSIFF